MRMNEEAVGGIMPMMAFACSTSTTTSSLECADFGGAGGEDQMEIEVRSNFDPLALFESSVITDGNGKATIPVKLPDSLTSYR